MPVCCVCVCFCVCVSICFRLLMGVPLFVRFLYMCYVLQRCHIFWWYISCQDYSSFGRMCTCAGVLCVFVCVCVLIYFWLLICFSFFVLFVYMSKLLQECYIIWWYIPMKMTHVLAGCAHVLGCCLCVLVCMCVDLLLAAAIFSFLC